MLTKRVSTLHRSRDKGQPASACLAPTPTYWLHLPKYDVAPLMTTAQPPRMSSTVCIRAECVQEGRVSDSDAGNRGHHTLSNKAAGRALCVLREVAHTCSAFQLAGLLGSSQKFTFGGPWWSAERKSQRTDCGARAQGARKTPSSSGVVFSANALARRLTGSLGACPSQ